MNSLLHENPEKTTPLGLIRYANEFFEAAAIVQDKIGARPGYEIVASIPVMYLTGHSIELALKSYLLHEGISLKELRTSYGHDLEKCLNKAKNRGLLSFVTFNTTEEGTFELLNTLYSTKQLEYIVTGYKHFPILSPLRDFSKKLLDAIGCVVGFYGQT